jgi:hypothetical protein
MVEDRAGERQRAATSVLVATAPQLEAVGGGYLEDCNEAAVVHPIPPDVPGSGVAAYAVDPEAAARLWQVSLDALAR